MMPPVRNKASATELVAEDRFAVVGHISFETCCGQENNVHEAKFIDKQWKIAEIFRAFSEAANGIHNHPGLEEELGLKLERRVKMFSLIPTLILRKIKGERGLHAIVKARLCSWKNKQWSTLIDNLQRDILIAHGPTVDNSRKNAA